MSDKKWGHDELASDLANHFRNDNERVVWEDMQLGPSGSPRPDVYVIPKTYYKFNPAAYEVKISRSDFLSDIKSGKWQSYYQYAKTITFAVPDGLVKKTEVPEAAGLILRKDKVWRYAKKPTVQTLETLPHKAWMKLLIDGIDRANRIHREEFHATYVKTKIIKKLLGEEIAEMISLGQELEVKIKSDNRLKQRQRNQIKELMQRRAALVKSIEERSIESQAKICRIVGLPETSGEWDIRRAIDNLVTDVNTDKRVAQLLDVIGKANRDFADARISIEPTNSNKEGE